MTSHSTPTGGRRERGVTTFVVLVLLTVMLLGGLAMARMTDAGTQIAGNLSFKERALQASEVGINTAYAATQALGTEETDSGNWYFAAQKALTNEGLPKDLDWDKNGAKLQVGAAQEFDVRYVVERMCDSSMVLDPERQCLLKRDSSIQSGKYGTEDLDPPSGRQFRITVRVTGPQKSRSVSFVQALITRG